MNKNITIGFYNQHLFFSCDALIKIKWRISKHRVYRFYSPQFCFRQQSSTCRLLRKGRQTLLSLFWGTKIFSKVSKRLFLFQREFQTKSTRHYILFQLKAYFDRKLKSFNSGIWNQNLKVSRVTSNSWLSPLILNRPSGNIIPKLSSI